MGCRYWTCCFILAENIVKPPESGFSQTQEFTLLIFRILVFYIIQIKQVNINMVCYLLYCLEMVWILLLQNRF
nr:MAG TPA: hypothetical protein [Caudoviricetes sp.]